MVLILRVFPVSVKSILERVQRGGVHHTARQTIPVVNHPEGELVHLFTLPQSGLKQLSVVVLESFDVVVTYKPFELAVIISVEVFPDFYHVSSAPTVLE